MDCQAMRKAQSEASISKKTTQCDCNDCQSAMRAHRNGFLKLQLSGAVAHILCQNLANGSINVWELPLKPKQRQKGAPQLVYLAGMTFIASAHKTNPPFSQGQVDFFTELQKLFNSKKENPLENPTIYLLNELFVPCKEAQDIIDRQVMTNQYKLDAKNMLNSKKMFLESVNLEPSTAIAESLLQEHSATSSSSNNKKKRGKKKKGKNKRGGGGGANDCRPKTQQQDNGEATSAMNTENNEWLEKLQQVLRTTNADDGGDQKPLEDLPMLCQEVASSSPPPAKRQDENATSETACALVAQEEEENKEEGASLFEMDVDQVMPLMESRNESEVNRNQVKSLMEKLPSELDELGVAKDDDVPVTPPSDSSNDGDGNKVVVVDDRDEATNDKVASVSNGDKPEQHVMPVSAKETNIKPDSSKDADSAAATAEKIESLEEKVRKLQQALKEKGFLLEVQEEMILEKETEIEKQQEALKEKGSLLEKQQETNKTLRLKLEQSESRIRAFQEAFQQHARAIASIGQEGE